MADEDLNLVLKKGVKEGRLSGSWKGDDLTTLLRLLPEYFLSGRKKRRNIFLAFLSLLILSFVIALIFKDQTVFIASILMVYTSIIALIIIGVKSLIMKIRGGSFTLDRDVEFFAKPVLDMILEDVRKGSVVSLELELRPVKSKEYLKKKSENYSKGKYMSCFDNFYERNFFSLKAMMHDGNRLSLACADYMKESVMTKKSPKGRDKTVYKYRKISDYQIRIRINPDRYKCEIKPEMKNGSGGDKIDLDETPKGAVLTMTFSETINGSSMGDILYKEPVKLVQRIARLYSCLAPASY